MNDHFSPFINQTVYSRIDFYWVQCTLGKETGQVPAHEILIPVFPEYAPGYKVKCNSLSHYRWQLSNLVWERVFWPQHCDIGKGSLYCGMPENTPGLFSLDASSTHPSCENQKTSLDICIDPPGEKTVPVENCGFRASLVPLQNGILILVPPTVLFPVTKFQIHLLFCSLPS